MTRYPSGRYREEKTTKTQKTHTKQKMLNVYSENVFNKNGFIVWSPVVKVLSHDTEGPYNSLFFCLTWSSAHIGRCLSRHSIYYSLPKLRLDCRSSILI